MRTFSHDGDRAWRTTAGADDENAIWSRRATMGPGITILGTGVHDPWDEV
jgi:hypothetical protein